MDSTNEEAKVSGIQSGIYQIMSLESVRKFAEKSKFRGPNPQWSVRWLKRVYEHAKQSEAETLRMDADGLIVFLRMLRDSGVPAWRRHQAAVVVARYLSMFGEVNARILEVVGKLADMATAERQGEACAIRNAVGCASKISKYLHVMNRPGLSVTSPLDVLPTATLMPSLPFP